MRLLDTKTQALVEFFDDEIPEYAILSHRWHNGEVSFKDICDGTHTSREGYTKLKSCCDLALRRGVSYVWIDTCCIDKSSSAELTEAINSMYQWYANAHECYAYLVDVEILALDTTDDHNHFAASAWFTRGWTLQELIAPPDVLFYNRRWEQFGTKIELQSVLSKITSVDVNVLAGRASPASCSIAQRMSWASKRITTRLEDVAYCLLGLFEVNMPLLYGEGSRAFFRLQRKIIKQLDDQTIFAWTDNRQNKPIFAPSPACFHGSKMLICVNSTNDPREGYTLANSGLSIQTMLIPFGMNRYLAPLSCGYADSGRGRDQKKSLRGYRRACIVLQQTQSMNHYVRVSQAEQDLVIKDADEIAHIRDHFGLRPRRVFIQQQLPVLAEPLFHGFEFHFNRLGLFGTGTFPSPTDVICRNVWSEQRPLFELGSNIPRAAGVFRFADHPRSKRVVYMHLGFDLDFAPICVIRSVERFTQGDDQKYVDFSQLNTDSTNQLLDLRWLLRTLEFRDASPDTLVSFRGERQNTAEIICTTLGLRLLFRVQYSAMLQCFVWRVTFYPLDGTGTRMLIDADEDNFSRPEILYSNIIAPRDPRGTPYEGEQLKPEVEVTDTEWEDEFSQVVLGLATSEERAQRGSNHEPPSESTTPPLPHMDDENSPELHEDNILNSVGTTRASEHGVRPQDELLGDDLRTETPSQSYSRKVNIGSYQQTLRQISQAWNRR